MMGSVRRKRPGKFNPCRGRHTYANKRKYTKHAKLMEQNIPKLLKHVRTAKTKPYQLVPVSNNSNGRSSVKIIVKRFNLCTTGKFIHLQKQSPLRFAFQSSPTKRVEGYRLCEVNKLTEYMNVTSRHAVSCSKAKVSLESGNDAFHIMNEIKRRGLVSTLLASCCCGKTFYFDTSNRDTCESIPCADVNIRAVWGAMVTGNGLSQMNESFGTIGVPGMTPQMFSSIEHHIGNAWLSCLQDDMDSAAAEEKRLAIERGDFHQGVPAITVICDGGWSKRSHRHTYNALGGVGVIFGAVTGKLLFIGIRNRHCHVCTLAETRQTEPIPHTCFKNWENSSQAMEADIICEGFLQAETKHGLRYMRIIGDGDSSVYSTIQERVPVWGKEVVKLECSNHACKCLRSNLEQLVSDKPRYKGRGKLTKQVRVRLTTAVRCAIRMRSKEADKRKACKQLERDIRNSIFHIFGDHQNCSNFCNAFKLKNKKPVRTASAGANVSSSSVDATSSSSVDATSSSSSVDATSSSSVDTTSSPSSSDDMNPEELLQDQHSYWIEGSSEKDMAESRCGVSYEVDLDQDIIRDVSILLDRLASKSNRLLGNYTTNLAESWMAIRMKLDGGKVINRCKRGSWHARCYGGALRKNFGPAWSPVVFQRCTLKRPGETFITLYRRRSQHLIRSLKCQNKPETKARARKRKMRTSSIGSTKKAKSAYGKDVVEPLPDVPAFELTEKCDSFYNENVNISDEKCMNIERQTTSQSLSTTWKEERRMRLTSSSFGEIVHKNAQRPVTPLVKRLLYSTFQGNRYTAYGLAQETPTIKEYIQYKADHGEMVNVEPMGLRIDRTSKFLAASTDGLVHYNKKSDTGLLEIKNVLQRNQLSFQEAAKQQTTFCLEYISTQNQLKLKQNHNYYYQCQGQMNIFEKPWIDFVVRRQNPYQLHVQRITRDKDLWNRSMLPKLKSFYFSAILPEIALPRHGLSPGIREPTKPWFNKILHVKKGTPTCDQWL